MTGLITGDIRKAMTPQFGARIIEWIVVPVYWTGRFEDKRNFRSRLKTSV